MPPEPRRADIWPISRPSGLLSGEQSPQRPIGAVGGGEGTGEGGACQETKTGSERPSVDAGWTEGTNRDQVGVVSYLPK